MQLRAADLMDSAIGALVYMERVMQHANLHSTAKLVAKGDMFEHGCLYTNLGASDQYEFKPLVNIIDAKHLAYWPCPSSSTFNSCQWDNQDQLQKF
ncbi:hypothetical protein J1N35_002111 [Gossypium stocksii]|uniref:Uncharacterized protein n=1 Tax=Gossypium stocksii TaxID=47602 RepID=A0A9D3WL51_9ROSI|nr:hypothetical protein J1N35_002111 [Gossypium stocksii]